MARNCGCSGASCGCSFEAFDNSIYIEGIGTARDPYRIRALPPSIYSQLGVADTDSLDLTLAGEGSVADQYIISGVVKDVVTTGTYTPTLTGITLGTGGTNISSWVKTNRRIRAHVELTLGTAAFALSGTPKISLPSAMHDAIPVGTALGLFSMFDTSAPKYYEGVLMADGTANGVQLYTPGTNGALSPIATALPLTWAAGDKIVVDFEYAGA